MAWCTLGNFGLHAGRLLDRPVLADSSIDGSTGKKGGRREHANMAWCWVVLTCNLGARHVATPTSHHCRES